MDLALISGQSLAAMRATTERDVLAWSKYGRSKGLPFRRLEWFMAQIALMVARGPIQGADSMTIEDFMLNPQTPEQEIDDPADGEGDVDAARDAFEYAPRREK